MVAPDHCTMVFGPHAYTLPHIIAAINPEIGTVEKNRIREPTGPITFTLSIRHIPFSSTKLSPGVAWNRVFTVEHNNVPQQFAVGAWDYTVDEMAILRCYAYRCSAYPKGSIGLLRIPKNHVKLLPGQESPPSTEDVNSSLAVAWKSVGPSNHLHVSMIFPYKYSSHNIAGAWDIIPRRSVLDFSSAFWREVSEWERIRMVLERQRQQYEARMIAEDEEERRANAIMVELLREPSEPLED